MSIKINLLFWLLFFYTISDSSAQKVDTIYDYNGTYNSPYNTFKNNNYMRVHFFNDSIFLFTMFENYTSTDGMINERNKHLCFNGYSFFGIARLVNYNSVKSWIGISDFHSTYSNPRRLSYLNLKGRGDFDIILKTIANKNRYAFGDSSFHYNVYQFFLQKNKISMKGIEGVTRFFEIGEYHQIDNAKMIIGVDPDDDFYKLNHNALYRDNTDIAEVKELCHSFPIPILEKLPENKPIETFNQGEKVYLVGHDFMKYTFVVQFDRDYKVTKSGWVLRTILKKYK